jgi:hypothetical protein
VRAAARELTLYAVAACGGLTGSTVCVTRGVEAL